jgi:DNA gyrase subunit A
LRDEGLHKDGAFRAHRVDQGLRPRRVELRKRNAMVGKRTPVEEYRSQSRGGKGIIDIKTSDRNGKVVNLLAVADDDEVMLITKDGQIVRTKVDQISVVGRNTQGVRCIALNEGDKLVSVARIPREEPVAQEPAAADKK